MSEVVLQIGIKGGLKMSAIIERIISGACKLGCLRCGRSLKVLSVTDDDIKIERCNCKKTEGEQNGQ